MNIDGVKKGAADPYFFLRLLIAYIQERGEITIKASTLDKVKVGSRLIKTVDDDSLIHVTVLPPEHTEVYVLDESKPQVAAQSGGATATTPQFEELLQKAKSAVMTNATLADLEKRYNKQAVVRGSAPREGLHLERTQGPWRKREAETEG